MERQQNVYFNAPLVVTSGELHSRILVLPENHISDENVKITSLTASEIAQLPPIEFIMGKLIIETVRCPILAVPRVGSIKMNDVHYLFKPDGALRVNITFLQFRLVEGEMIHLINIDDDDHSEYSLSEKMQLYPSKFMQV